MQYKTKKNPKTFQEARQFALRFYIQKARHFPLRAFSAFIYKRDVTLRYMTFLYTKGQTLQKKQDNLCYVFIYKSWTLCITPFFVEFFKFAKGGGYIYTNKEIHFAFYFYVQKTINFTWRLEIQKSRHFALHFYIQKTTYFALRLYIYNKSNSTDT